MNSVGILREKINQDRGAKSIFLFCVVTSFIIGVLCHIPIITGYLLPVTSNHIGGRCISALLFLLCMAISIAQICVLFDIKRKIAILIAIFLLITSPWVTLNMSDYSGAEIKSFVFMLASISAYFLFRKGRKYKIIAFGVGIIGSALNELFLSVFLTLVVFKAIHEILFEEQGEVEKKNAIKEWVWLFATLVAIVIISIVIVVIRGRGIAIVSNVKNSFPIFKSYYIGQDFLNNAWRKRKLINIVLFVLLGIILFLRLFLEKMDWKKWIATIILLLVCPVAMCGSQMGEIIEPVSMRTLPSMNLIYIFILSVTLMHVIPEQIDIPVSWMTWMGLIYVSYLLILYGQIYQNTMQTNHVKLYALVNRMIPKIEEQGVTENVPLLVYGNMRYGNYPDQYAQELAGYILTGALKQDLFDDNAEIASNQWVDYLNVFHDMDFRKVDDEQYDVLVHSEAFAKMGTFPEEGTVKIIDGTVVVKLSN